MHRRTRSTFKSKDRDGTASKSMTIDRGPLLAPDGAGLQSTYYTGLIFGPNGCGKTTIAEKIALFYARGTNVDGNVWAIDPNGAWEGSDYVKSLWPEDGIPGVDEMLIDSRRWKPGLIIFDDADQYMSHSTQIKTNYLQANRHNKKDMLVLARRPQGIPKDAIAIARFVILFAGSLMEVYAREYFEGIYPQEIIDAVPRTEYHYLLIRRQGGQFSYERRKTTPRKVKLASDKR